MNINPWPYNYIRKRAEQATMEAQHDNLQPAAASNVLQNYRISGRFNIPFLGDYVPDGWNPTGEVVFVSNPGISPLGSAISPYEFYRQVETNYGRVMDVGFGVIEQGQYQVLIETYRKETDAKETKT